MSFTRYVLYNHMEDILISFFIALLSSSIFACRQQHGTVYGQYRNRSGTVHCGNHKSQSQRSHGVIKDRERSDRIRERPAKGLPQVSDHVVIQQDVGTSCCSLFRHGTQRGSIGSKCHRHADEEHANTGYAFQGAHQGWSDTIRGTATKHPEAWFQFIRR